MVHPAAMRAGPYQVTPLVIRAALKRQLQVPRLPLVARNDSLRIRCEVASFVAMRRRLGVALCGSAGG
jgi:hypothetical protein